MHLLWEQSQGGTSNPMHSTFWRKHFFFWRRRVVFLYDCIPKSKTSFGCLVAWVNDFYFKMCYLGLSYKAVFKKSRYQFCLKANTMPWLLVNIRPPQVYSHKYVKCRCFKRHHVVIKCDTEVQKVLLNKSQLIHNRRGIAWTQSVLSDQNLQIGFW